jgi:proline iminopeptidase
MKQSGFIQSGPFCLKYIIEGEGPTILVIGSALYSQRTFSHQLRNHFKLVFIDHRGFAPNPGPVNLTEFDLDVLLDDIELMRKKLNLGNVIIMGHSGHSYLALEYAKEYQENVSHVVMIGTGPDQSHKSNEAAQKYFDECASDERKLQLQKDVPIMKSEIKNHPEGRLIIMLKRLRAKGWYDYTFDSTDLWQGVTVNMPMFDYVWGGIFRDLDITKGLQDFDIPVLLMLGRYDFIVAPPESWKAILSKFKYIDVQIFEQSGHTPQYEESEAFDYFLINNVN